MGKHAQLIMGPAGSGKSTYCNTIRMHCENTKRSVHCVNLDPAAEEFHYPVSINIKDLIDLDDVMEELPYGPNGGLIFALEFLMQNIEWFHDQVGDFEDDYLLIDCPGQIELYSHFDIMHNFVSQLSQWGYQVCGVYLLDCSFMNDPAKFISGTLMCLSAMIRMEIPHVNVLSKMDLVKQREEETIPFTELEIPNLLDQLNQITFKKFHTLNHMIANLIEDYSMVAFVKLDSTDEQSVEHLLAQIDNAIQFGEDAEVKVPQEFDEDELDD